MKKYIAAVIILALMAVPAGGCEEAPSVASTIPAGMGRIEVRVTDKPPEYGEIEAIDVTIDVSEGVMVHKAATEEDGKGAWIPIPITGPNTFELLALQEVGVDALLSWGDVDPGKYTQIKMTIEKVEISFKGEPEPILAELPSGKLKFVRPFEVVDGETTIIMLDFIADKSVVITGAKQSDEFKVIFKPVVKLLVFGKGKPIELLYSLGATVNATAELSTEEAYSGEESIHLLTTGDVGDGDEARIVVIPLPEGTTLGDIESISWWVYAASGYPPHLDITLDCDGDSVVDNEDMLTAEMNLNCVGAPKSIATLQGEISYNTGWLQTFELTSGDGFGAITGDTTFWVTKMGSGDLNAPSGTLAQWKAGTVANDPESEMTTPVITGSAPVVKLEIEVDNWVLQTEAYVDDIEIVIDGVTYTIDI